MRYCGLLESAPGISGDGYFTATLLMSMLGSVAEFERSMIRERQREGIELAKKRGAYRGR